MVDFQVHQKFDFSQDAYRALLEDSCATAFQHPVWLSAFYENLVKNRPADPLIVTLHDESGLAGLVPLVRRRKAGLLLLDSADLGVTDYAAPVLATRLIDADRTKLQQGFRAAIGRHDILRIRPVREEHLDAWALLLEAAPRRLDFSAHATELTEPFEEWRAAHVDRKLSGQMVRKGKRWAKQHKVVLERLRDAKSIRLAIANLSKLRAGRFEGDPIQEEAFEAFYASVAVAGADEGVAETWIMTSDNEPAGILFGLTHKGRFLYLLIGADYDRFGRHSPGLQMYDGIMQDWLARGGAVFDFTIGDEPFKMQFGAQATAMSVILQPGSLLGRVAMGVASKRLAGTGAG